MAPAHTTGRSSEHHGIVQSSDLYGVVSHSTGDKHHQLGKFYHLWGGPQEVNEADTDETPGLVPVSVNFRVSVSVPVSV